jgi:AmmeMemoRadiSam system protein A
MTRKLTPQQQHRLLALARTSIALTLAGDPLPPLDLQEMPDVFQEPGACFVTLSKEGELRGCVGSIEAVRPLAREVRDRAISAAFQDPRFPQLRQDELDQIRIEISTLTKPRRLHYQSPQELPDLLRPGVDGVILHQGYRRATFLPQVWDKLPLPEQFLGRLCQKMGLSADAWKAGQMEVEIYQVEEFAEDGPVS